VLKLLLHLQESRGLAVLFITHDLAVARRMGDRIVVMAQGRLPQAKFRSPTDCAPPQTYHTV